MFVEKAKKILQKVQYNMQSTLGNYLHVGLCLQCFQKVTDEQILKGLCAANF